MLVSVVYQYVGMLVSAVSPYVGDIIAKIVKLFPVQEKSQCPVPV